MESLGDKLAVAHTQVTDWVGSVRRSFQGALSFVSNSMDRARGGEEGGGFKRAASLRSLASRGRESIRRLSVRSRQHLRRRISSTSASDHDAQGEQLKQRRQDEGKDTDTLVQETDSQYGTWDTGLDTNNSLTPVTPSSDIKPSLTPDHLSPERQKELLNFPQSSTTLLDSSAQRSKAQLSKSCRRRRAPPSRAARHSAVLDGVELVTDEWRFKDTTEDKPDSAKLQDDESDEEEPTRDSRTSATSTPASSQPQRVSFFPGVDPSVLMAQIKKRGETDSQTDGSSPSQLPRSPKSPFLGRASRVLPPVGGKENGEESPQWLKELKTKKRFSQIENDC